MDSLSRYDNRTTLRTQESQKMEGDCHIKTWSATRKLKLPSKDITIQNGEKIHARQSEDRFYQLSSPEL
uniref:Uncharacterized protein n=1 Tax=Arion vulgaris TaxID=1028688 RepID=A0A0B6ZRI5_9EUPU